MTGKHPDVPLYAANFVFALVLSGLLGVLYLFSWKEAQIIDIGFRTISFGGQQLLNLDMENYLANELELTLRNILFFSVPVFAAASVFFIPTNYEILWWFPLRPESKRIRIYSFIVTFFLFLFLLSKVSEVAVQTTTFLSPTSDEAKLWSVTITIAFLNALFSTVGLFGAVGFATTYFQPEHKGKRT